MNRIHLALSGKWAECRATKQACPRAYHLDNMTVADAEATIPLEFVHHIIEGLEHGPITRPNGDREWFGEQRRGLHRDYDRPAVIKADGTQEWWLDGKRHRVGDKPAIIKADGSQEWWRHGKRHRMVGKPAVQGADGHLEWWVKGRPTGAKGQPAVVYADGSQDYWLRADLGLQHFRSAREAYEYFRRGTQ